MNGHPKHASVRAAETPRPLVVAAGLIGFLVVVALGAAVLLGGGVALVWATGRIETWLDLPAMSMLVAVLGLGLVATVFVGTGRIVGAIREHRGPLDMLGDLMERAAAEDEDEDHSGEALDLVERRDE